MRIYSTAFRKVMATLITAVILFSSCLTLDKNVVYADYNQGIVTFVTSLYSDCLGRTPDSAGLDDWCAKLASGQISGKQAAYGFFFSSEFQTNANSMTDDELIDAYYKVFLNRAADPSGKSYWAGQIAGTTNDISILFTGFADSTEFADKCASYGITAGSHVEVPSTIRESEAIVTESSGSVALNEENFPDPIFREYVAENWDSDNNGILNPDEILAVNRLNPIGLGISDLSGIEFFPELIILNCWDNRLTEIDISHNKKLGFLTIYHNSIETLDISQNPCLITVYNDSINGNSISWGFPDDIDLDGSHFGYRSYMSPRTVDVTGMFGLLQCDINVNLVIS